MKKQLSMFFIILLISAQSMAEVAKKDKKEPVLDKQKFSIGAGVARNSVGPFDETGFQFFAAYDLNKVNLMEGVNTSIEFGYMDYGSFGGGDDGGLWATAVVDGALGEKFGWLARLGFDLGDDSGLMFGAGLGLDLNEKSALRLEYVVRDNVDSIQLNFLYHL